MVALAPRSIDNRGMASKLNPYLSFKTGARAAMEFYKSVFGGKLTITTFAEFGMKDVDGVMHSMLEAPNGITFMASDTPPSHTYTDGARISMALNGGDEDEPELAGYFAKLSEGGQVMVPLAKAPWGDMFGMLTDKFGIVWMANIAGKKS